MGRIVMNGYMTLGIGIAVALAIAVVVGVVLALARSSGASKPGAAPRKNGASATPPSNGAPAKFTQEDAAALERAKTLVHGILRSLSAHIDRLTGESSKFETDLVEHKNAITKAMTVASIRELERVIIGQLDEMRGANDRYRAELAAANATIREQEEQLAQLQSDAGMDFLTDLPNRRAFEKRLDEFMDMARRYGKPFSLVIVDIDHFKQINDQFGHLAGDRILRAIARVLSEHMRTSDFIARFGGEEFVAILPETTITQARALAEKLRTKVERAVFRYEGTAINVTISAGVSESVVESDTQDRLFGRADAALYRAKKAGRNCVEVAVRGSEPKEVEST